MSLVNPDTGETVTTHLPIDDIVIGERHRSDFGDIDSLAKSIRSVGLLHAVVVTKDHRLIAGHRRLKACQALGIDVVPVRIISKVEDAVSLLAAERDENTCRKDFTPTEAVALGRALERLERPKAAERQGGPGRDRSGKLPERSAPVRDVVGEAVGMSGRTYEKAKQVIDIAEDPEAPEPIRELAKTVVAEMDRTGKVDPAHKQVQAAKALHGLVNADPDVQLAQYRKRAAAALVQAGHLAEFDPERLALTITPEEWVMWRQSARQSAEWFERLLALEPGAGLRVMNGGRS